MEEGHSFGTSGAEQKGRKWSGELLILNGLIPYVEENNQNRNTTEVFWGKGRSLGLHRRLLISLLKLEACRSHYYCSNFCNADFFFLCTLRLLLFLRFIIIDEHATGKTRFLGGVSTLDSTHDTIYQGCCLPPRKCETQGTNLSCGSKCR